LSDARLRWISETMSPTRSRFCRVSSIFCSACFFRALYLVMPAASSMSMRRSSGFAETMRPTLALLDDRVGLGADARAEEEIGDVLQADLGLVDQVLARYRRGRAGA
jgi:hypothetical protein